MVLKLFRKLGIQSKVLAMVLLASLLSLLLTGLLAWSIGSNVLTAAASNQLVGLRNSRAESIKDYFGFLNNHVLTMGEGFLAVNGLKDFSAAYNKLSSATLNAAQKKELLNYYETEFIPKLRKNVNGNPTVPTYLPSTPQDNYITYYYTAHNPHARNLSLLDDPGDGSEYSAIHKKYNYRFRRILDVFGYSDVFLVDAAGNVVYSVAKEADMGSNLLTGPFADTALGKTFDEIRKSRDPNFVYTSDVEHYKASYGEPGFFIGTTVFDGDKFIGALIYQINPSAIDKVMTDNRKWEEQGLGETGESYLIAQDHKLRSSPREFLEHPEAYYKLLIKQGVSKEKIDWIKRAGTPVLIQDVHTEAATNSLAGKQGEIEYTDYRGKRSLASYQPLRVGDFEWGLVAKIDKSEIGRAHV